MLFNSFVFLFVFLPIVVVAYFAAPAHRARLVLIVVASYVFYAYAKWWFALLMAVSTIAGFVGGQLIERAATRWRRKLLLGLTRIFRIELPWNFNRPYRATSPIEFWRRWHVTLSTWLRDYLYIPLGGNRKGERRRDANLLTTMGLGGLWHGASLNFVVWGLYQGVLLLGTHHLRRLPFRLPRPVAIGITFVLVMVGWAFFR